MILHPHYLLLFHVFPVKYVGDSMLFLLDPNFLKLHIENKNEDFHIAQDLSITTYSPYDHIYAPYDDGRW
jgi:hypothetical protein